MTIDPDSIAENLAVAAEAFMETVDTPVPVLEDYNGDQAAFACDVADDLDEMRMRAALAFAVRQLPRAQERALFARVQARLTQPADADDEMPKTGNPAEMRTES